jgi:hypothetical protein
VAEVLGVNRHELLDLMSQYCVHAIDHTSEELKQEVPVGEIQNPTMA